MPLRDGCRRAGARCFGQAALLLSLTAIGPVFADGGFVWRGYERLREPRQKAIIVFDEGVEDLLLQVRYEGPPDDFGWIIPVPAHPEVRAVIHNPFPQTEVRSRYTNLYDTPLTDFLRQRWAIDHGAVAGAAGEVRVDSAAEIGDYEATVLQGDSGKAIQGWLESNGFVVPAGGAGVLDHYAGQGWHFVACRVRPSRRTVEKGRLLALGELAPLHLTFSTVAPIYPLRISALGEGPSEVLIALFAKRLYAHPRFMPRKDDFPTRRELERRLEEASGDLLFARLPGPVVFSQFPSLPLALHFGILRGDPGPWYCSVMARKLVPEELSEDLLFSAAPDLIESLVAALRTAQIEAGFDSLPQADGSEKPVICKPFATPPAIEVPVDLPEAFVRRLPRLPREGEGVVVSKRHDSRTLTGAEVRHYGRVFEAWLRDRRLTPDFATAVLDFELPYRYLFEYCRTREERLEFLAMLAHPEVLPYGLDDATPYPIARLCLPSCLRTPQPELLAGLKAGHFVVGRDWPRPLPDPAIPFFRRISMSGPAPVGEKTPGDRSPQAARQLAALELLCRYRDPLAFEVLAPWLGHSDPSVRRTALNVMALTVNNSVQQCAESGDAWGVRSQVCASVLDDRERNLALVRPLAADPDPECRLWALRLLALIGDEESVPRFAGILDRAAEQATREDAALVAAALVAASNAPSPEYVPVLLTLLRDTEAAANPAVSREDLILRALAYSDRPSVREVLLRRENLPLLLRAREVVAADARQWLAELRASSDEPLLRLAEMLFADTAPDVDDPATRAALEAILSDRRLPLDVYRQVAAEGRALWRASGGSGTCWADRAESRQALIRGLIERPDDVLATTEAAGFAWLCLVDCPADTLPGRLELTRDVVAYIDRCQAERRQLPPGLGLWGRPLRRLAVTLGIFNRDLILAHMASFGPQDPNRRLCATMLGLLVDDGASLRGGARWKRAERDFREAVLSGQPLAAKTVAYGVMTYRPGQFSALETDQVRRFVSFLRTDPVDVDCALLMFSVLVHDDEVLRAIERQLRPREGLTAGEAYLLRGTTGVLGLPLGARIHWLYTEW